MTRKLPSTSHDSLQPPHQAAVKQTSSNSSSNSKSNDQTKQTASDSSSL